MFNKNDTAVYINWKVYDEKRIPCMEIDKDISQRGIECDVAMYYINNVTSCFEIPRVWSLIADICYAWNIVDSKYVAYIFNSLRYYPYNEDVEISDEESIDLFIKRVIHRFPIAKWYLSKYNLEK